MKKMFFIMTILAMMVFAVSVNVYAEVDSFSKGYGYNCWSDVSPSKVLASTIDGLVGQTIEGSVVGENDWVLKSDISAETLNRYKAYHNGINNKYIWQQYIDDSGNLAYKKLYGGFGGFYGYMVSGESAENGAVPRIYALTNDDLGLGKGGAYSIKPGKNTITYGRYDLNLEGLSKFTQVFKPTNNILNCLMYFVQDEEGYLKDREKENKIFEIDRLGQIRFRGSGVVSCTITKDSYYTLECWVDTREEEPKYKIGIKKYGETAFLAETEWTTFGPEYDFDKSMGIKLLTYGVDDFTEWQIAEFMLEHQTPLDMVTTQEDIDKVKIPLKDGTIDFKFNKIFSVSDIAKENIKVMDEDGKSVDVKKIEVDNDTITIALADLLPARKYSIEFVNISSGDWSTYSGKFTITTPDSAEFTSVNVNETEDGYDLDINIWHYLTDKSDCIILTTLNDGNNMIKGAYYLPIQMEGVGEKKYVITGINNAKNYKYKIYLINNFSDMQVITNEFIK